MYNGIIEGYIHGKRDKGKQRRTWMDDLKDWTGIRNFGALKQRQGEMEVHGSQPSYRRWYQMVMILYIYIKGGSSGPQDLPGEWTNGY